MEEVELSRMMLSVYSDMVDGGGSATIPLLMASAKSADASAQPSDLLRGISILSSKGVIASCLPIACRAATSATFSDIGPSDDPWNWQAA